MIPGELFVETGDIELNVDRPTVTLMVANTGDRPIQVGSHFHFFEVNKALNFDRAQSRGMRLDIPAGTAVRFEPGDEKEITLVALAGSREVYGLNGLINGALDTNTLDTNTLEIDALDVKENESQEKREGKKKGDKKKKK